MYIGTLYLASANAIFSSSKIKNVCVHYREEIKNLNKAKSIKIAVLRQI